MVLKKFKCDTIVARVTNVISVVRKAYVCLHRKIEEIQEETEQDVKERRIYLNSTNPKCTRTLNVLKQLMKTSLPISKLLN